MAYKTCPDCGSRIFEHGCVNCNEEDYITMQDWGDFKHPPDNRERPDNRFDDAWNDLGNTLYEMGNEEPEW